MTSSGADRTTTILLYQMDETRQSIGRTSCPARPRRSAAAVRGRQGRRLIDGLTGLLVLAATVAAAPRTALAAGDQGEGSGLPLPRFASLKSDHVNVRGGPNKDQDVAWVYTRPALPVEITEEFENWRRIRDRDGSEGWVYHTLLSGRRTAVVARPKAPSPAPSKPQPGTTPPVLVPLYAVADSTSAVRAMLEPGVLGQVKRCDGRWCRLTGNGFDGWIEQSRLWGVYPNEKIE
jgi:SH3-like domain-containing protein